MKQSVATHSPFHPANGAGDVPSRAAQKSWAIQMRPSLLEQRLWASRGVDIYDVDLDVFVDSLGGPSPAQTLPAPAQRHEVRP